MITPGLAKHDFETYSEAGHHWNETTQKWTLPPDAPAGNKKGLSIVGLAVYAEHPTTEVLTYSYELPGRPKRRWRPGRPNPQDLFDYLAAGGLLEAHKALFEMFIWEKVCVPKYGWPSILPHRYQLRCSMAKANVNQYPGALGNLSQVLNLPIPKDKDGKRLLDKFSVPRSPTKTDPRRRIQPADDPADFERLCQYCDTDLDAEGGASERMEDLTDDELMFWWVDQEINWRGLAVDREGVRDCIAVLRQVLEQYGEECRQLTGGITTTQLQQLMGWLAGRGVYTESLDEAHIGDLLTPGRVTDPLARRVLELRQLTGSASVKKLFAIEFQATADNRLHDLFVHHGARTGRPTGGGPQPLNLPRAGPNVRWCVSPDCAKPFGAHHTHCPWCVTPAKVSKPSEWSAEAVDHVLALMRHRSKELIEYYFGDALLCISGCLRGLFVAGPGMELIASDYSSIEAVVIAMLAGEEWRIEAFQQNLPIYLLSAAKVTGRSLEFYLDYNSQHGHHHPDRQKIGKVNELANGFGGWINSSKAFGSEDPDDVIKHNILAWRDASPAIVELWGGQFRGSPWSRGQVIVDEIRCFGEVVRPAGLYDAQTPNYFGFEGCAVQAILWPGQVFSYRGIQFYVRGDTLIIRLLSGRELKYHEPRLQQSTRPHARVGEYSITYMTWNTNTKYGPMGWIQMSTFGGRITENIVQATAHDIQRYGILTLRAAGYPVVLHVYDENVAEIPLGTGSIEHFEALMSTMPPWAAGWPIKAHGGWRGKRYRKA